MTMSLGKKVKPTLASEKTLDTGGVRGKLAPEQEARLRELCKQSGTEFLEGMSREEAERRIAELEKILR